VDAGVKYGMVADKQLVDQFQNQQSVLTKLDDRFRIFEINFQIVQAHCRMLGISFAGMEQRLMNYSLHCPLNCPFLPFLEILQNSIKRL
jgi:hypothetical protein